MKPALVVLFLAINTFVYAQTCNIGLGDPIVNINFGSGPNYGPPLAPGITNMKYDSGQCVVDGGYEIVNSVFGCYPADWWNLSSDHTGNPNGYFMLIGANDQPSVFYTQTVSGLCGNTTYQFAAWVMNMASHAGEILPDLTFTIKNTNGSVIQSLETGGVPVTSPTLWNQYAFYFSTPPGVSSVVLQMSNNAAGGYGNDLALDDITFRTSGPSISIAIAGQAGDTVTLCSGPANELQFLGTVGSCYASTVYQWQQNSGTGGWRDIPGADNLNYSAFPTAAGDYLYRLTAAQAGNIGVANCQVASAADSVLVLQETTPGLSIAPDPASFCSGSQVQFTANSSGGGTAPFFQWTLNGAPVGTNGSTYSNDLVNNGDQIRCMMTSNSACLIVPSATAGPLTVQVLPIPVSSVTVNSTATAVCADSLVSFTASPVNGGADPRYQWQVNGQPVGTDTSVYSSGNWKEGDVVTAVMTSGLACASPVSSTNSITMTVYSIPQVDLTPDTVIAGGSSIRLSPVVIGPVSSYQWDPATWLDPPTSQDPLASPPGTTTYSFTATSPNGCTASAKERIVVFYDLVLPNAFSPNGDGRNDIFRIPASIAVNIARFSIFDRWGREVFTTSNSGVGWDGRSGSQFQPAGTYVWMVEYEDPILKRMLLKKGTVELIR